MLRREPELREADGQLAERTPAATRELQLSRGQHDTPNRAGALSIQTTTGLIRERCQEANPALQRPAKEV